MFRLMIFLVIFTCSLSLSAADLNCTNKHCLAVIDAGSSGSRLHIYSFEFDKTSNSPINIHEEASQKNAPGIASIRSDVTTVNAYMDELFKGINAENIPVYFYATAGMRMLSSPDQKNYYQNIKQWFTKNSNWNLVEAKTISGNDEGLYGWLATNKQLGRFENNAGFVGFMDMGGASVQIATPITNDNAILDKEHDVVRVNVYNRDITLFIHSFLGLGQTEVAHQSLDKKECYSHDYEMADNLLGRGDALSCEAHAEGIINAIHKVKDIVQPVLADAPKAPWYVSGGVVYIATDSIFNLPNTFTNEMLLEKTQLAICQQSWDTLANENLRNPLLYGYCQFASYNYALMVNGYGLSPKQEIHYLPVKGNPDWALGVVLMQKNA